MRQIYNLTVKHTLGIDMYVSGFHLDKNNPNGKQARKDNAYGRILLHAGVAVYHFYNKSGDYARTERAHKHCRGGELSGNIPQPDPEKSATTCAAASVSGHSAPP